ncbi:HAD family phosphatase [Methylocystis iwaonis]|uniref:HAD family hydrolase n=1 Tax=Methylocystis iwaonis TaxID=2885079 RepID=UPI002E7AB24E|nr:HAD family phosphatase [Methylocystis iwaonis]
MSFPSPVRAVLFDMDGTLLDTERLYQSALREACCAIGFDPPDDFFLQMLGRPWAYCYEQLREAFPPFDQDRFNAHFDMLFGRLVDEGIPLKPGVEDFLDYLAARATPMAVVTSTFEKTAERHLADAGIRAFFETVVARDIVENGKPAPDSFLLAAKRLGVAPQSCLALEDSPAGVRAAAAAMTIMIPDAIAPTAEDESFCLKVAKRMADVLELVRRAEPTAP